jgi:hypothetical protein
MRGKNCQKKRAIYKKNSFKKPYNNKIPSIKIQIALKNYQKNAKLMGA